jgi:membrane protein
MRARNQGLLPAPLRGPYQRLSRVTKGAMTIILAAFRQFRQVRATEAAAGMAYYAIFSLFPLLLVVIALGSYTLERNQIRELVFQVLNQAFPISLSFIESNIDQVLDQRGPVGVVGVVGLMWSASSVFSALVTHINRAWPESESHGFLVRRFLGLTMIAVIIVTLFSLWLLTNAGLAILPRLDVLSGLGTDIYQTVWWRFLSGMVPFSLAFSMFLLLYRWVPNRQVNWSEAFWGALVASTAWSIATNLFGWYFRSGLSNYSLVYGSLGAIVALMFWIYIISLIVLFGAHISASVSRVD